MLKNDYRRALIMLRSAVRGLSGHVRLERRTLTGSLRFSLSGVSGASPLTALLARRVHGQWRATALGELRVDSRGQAGLNYTFDPRNLSGADLNEYPLILVARDGECLMTGFLNGSVEVDWGRLESAVRSLSSAVEARASVSQLPTTDKRADLSTTSAGSETDAEPKVSAQSKATVAAETTAGVEAAVDEVEVHADTETKTDAKTETQADAKTDATIHEEPIEPETESIDDESCCCESDPLIQTETVAEPDDRVESKSNAEPEAVSESELCCCAPDAVAQEETESTQTEAVTVLQEASSGEPDSPSEAELKEPTTALTLLQLNPGQRWPDCIEPIHTLFARQPAFVPFEADGYVFVRAPLYWAGQAEGESYCAIGVRVEDGIPARVCYALPGTFALQPPPGMEGYAWRGDGPSGWWVTFLDAQTGEEAEE